MEEYCRILIIDDEFIMRQGLKHMADWEKEGFRIVGEVSNGREGLEMIPKVHPHIILCDIVMPEMDGVEFAGILKDKYPEVRIIVLSGYDDYQYVRPALMYGASDYILKPMLKPEELLETLAKTARQIPGLKLKKHQEASFGKMLEDYFLGKTDEVSASVVKNQFTGTFFRVYAANVRKHQGKKSMAAVLFGKAEEYLEQMKECCHELLFFNEETLCIIFNYDAKRAEWLSQEAEKLTELLTLLYGQYFAVMGQEFRSLSELREDFQKNVLPSSVKAFYNRDIHLKIVKDCVHGERKKFDFSHYSGLLASGRYQDALDMLAAYVEEAGTLR